MGWWRLTQLLRNLLRAHHVLRTEGLSVLRRKIRRRLNLTEPSPVGKAVAWDRPDQAGGMVASILPRLPDSIGGRRASRRALIIDLYMLTPDRESGSLRMWHLSQLLGELGFRVAFAAASLEAPPTYVSALRAAGIEVLHRPRIRSLGQYLKQQGDELELVILSRADAALAWIDPARRHCPRARIVFDTVDLHFLRERRLAELTGRWSTRWLAAWRRQEELSLIRRADTTLVVSPVERDLLAREQPGADIRLLSNIHPIRGCRRPFAERRDVFFVGAFAHPPNCDGVRWLCQEVMPRVITADPSLRCAIIGADPPPDILALASEQIRVLGYVPDLAAYLDGYRLSVAPLRYGAGVKGKVSLSLASGLPVVVTPQAAEGMSLVHGESAWIAATPQGLARGILRLNRDPELWSRLSAGGLAVAERHFGTAAARRVLTALVDGKEAQR